MSSLHPHPELARDVVDARPAAAELALAADLLADANAFLLREAEHLPAELQASARAVANMRSNVVAWLRALAWVTP
jgi:hypothetical protein